MKTQDAALLFIKSRRAKGLSPESIRWYSGILGDFAKNCVELPETPEPIEEYLADCCTGDERKHGYFRALKGLYNFLDRRLNCFPNPMKLIDPPRRRTKRPKALTPEELNQLIAYPHSAKIKTAILFLADTGCRIGELYNLNLRDISETPWGYIAKVTGKTGSRYVPLIFETYQALTANLPLGYTLYRLRRLISKAFDDTMIEGSALTLRHTFGTLWGGDELILQSIMGHAHLSTTRIYRHLRTEVLSAQHQVYSPLKMIFGRTKRMDL